MSETPIPVSLRKATTGANRPEENEADLSKHVALEQNAQLCTGSLVKLNTHDVSFVEEHIPNIKKFAEDLQLAIDAAWPTRRKSRYKEVHVLLMSWEDDNLGVEKEIRRLGYVFSNLYRFNVQEFRIPRKTPGKATSKRVWTFLEKDKTDSLLIFYYAGHSRLSQQSNEPPIWAATNKPGSPTLPSGGVQQLFEEAESDVLLFYDTCHSAHPAVSEAGPGVTEVIAACGFETQAPEVGPHSFTNALIRELEEAFTGPPISVAQLHARIIGQLKSWKPDFLRNEDGNLWTDENGRPKYECHKRRTPVHSFLTFESPNRSIVLAPLPSILSHAAVADIDRAHSPQRGSSTSPEISYTSKSEERTGYTSPTTVSQSSKHGKEPQVLLAIRLEDDDFLDDIEEDGGKKLRKWCDWLKDIPEGVKNISIQGLYKSFSTLVLISVPVVLWTTLPDNSAYTFIGFVTSTNLAQHPLSAAEQVANTKEVPHDQCQHLPEVRQAARQKSGTQPIHTEGKSGNTSRKRTLHDQPVPVLVRSPPPYHRISHFTSDCHQPLSAPRTIRRRPASIFREPPFPVPDPSKTGFGRASSLNSGDSRPTCKPQFAKFRYSHPVTAASSKPPPYSENVSPPKKYSKPKSSSTPPIRPIEPYHFLENTEHNPKSHGGGPRYSHRHWEDEEKAIAKAVADKLRQERRDAKWYRENSKPGLGKASLYNA